MCIRFFVFLLLFYPFVLFAQKVAADPKEFRAKLEQINKLIQEQEFKLKASNGRISDIQKDIKLIDAGIKLNSQKRDEAIKSIELVLEEEKVLQPALSAAQSNVERLRAIFERRIVAHYKSRRKTSLVDYLSRASSVTELAKRGYILKEIAKKDKNNWEWLQSEISKLNEYKEQLQKSREKKQSSIDEIDKLDEELIEQRQIKANLLKEEKAKVKESKELLAKLKSAAAKVDSILSDILSGKMEIVLEKEQKLLPAETGNVQPSNVILRGNSGGNSGVFVGKGLSIEKGNLKYPIKGKIVQGYGRTQHEEFRDILFSKGIEFNARSGSEVRAVASGRVIFSQIMSSYGRLVILDHGDRYYTLYGRLGRITTKLGDVVDKGQVIAILGDPDIKGRNFYFELRIKGKASDPNEFFGERKS